MKVLTLLIIDVSPVSADPEVFLGGLGKAVKSVTRSGKHSRLSVGLETDSLEQRNEVVRKIRGKLPHSTVTIQTTQYFSG